MELLQELFLQELSLLVSTVLVLSQQLKILQVQRLVSVNHTHKNDAVPTSAATLGAAPNFSSVTSYAAGDETGLAGTVTSAGVLTVTAGGAGTSAIGQFVSEITVID